MKFLLILVSLISYSQACVGPETIVIIGGLLFIFPTIGIIGLVKLFKWRKKAKGERIQWKVYLYTIMSLSLLPASFFLYELFF